MAVRNRDAPRLAARKHRFGGLARAREDDHKSDRYRDRAVWQELAKMIISPTVTETEFEHLSIQITNQTRRAIQARTLGFETTYKTIKPAHG